MTQALDPKIEGLFISRDAGMSRRGATPSGPAYHLTVTGAPRTKKTSNQLVSNRGRAFVLPSQAWRRWLASCSVMVTRSPGTGRACNEPFIPFRGPMFPDECLNCAAVFYRDARRGDAVGYYQGLADLLEKKRVLQDDAQIVTWWGSRMLLDKSNPRVELVLEECAQ